MAESSGLESPGISRDPVVDIGAWRSRIRRGTSAHYHVEMGLALRREACHEQALAHLREAFRLDPTDARAARALRIQLISMQLTPEADAVHQSALQVDRDYEMSALLSEIRVAVAGARYETAMDLSDQLRAMRPDHVEACAWAYVLQRQAGRQLDVPRPCADSLSPGTVQDLLIFLDVLLHKAKTSNDIAAELEYLATMSRLTLLSTPDLIREIQLLQFLGKFDTARDKLETAAVITPEIELCRGIQHQVDGNLQAAAASYRHGIEISATPQESLYVAYARLLIQQTEYETARQILLQSQAAHPGNCAMSMGLLGLVSRIGGDLNDALQHHVKSTSMPRYQGVPQSLHGLTLTALGRHGEAFKLLREAVALAPGAVTHLACAIHHLETGSPEAAQEQCHLAKRTQPALVKIMSGIFPWIGQQLAPLLV